MFDLEQCAKRASLLSNTLICQVERTPALASLAGSANSVERSVLSVGGCGAAVTAVTQCWLYITVWRQL